jgi:hypothetical protein
MKIIFFLICLFSCSCVYTQNRVGSDSVNYEDELLSQLFWQFIFPSPPCDSSLKIMEDNEIYWSDFYSDLQNSKHTIYLLDTLIVPIKVHYNLSDIPKEYQKLSIDLLSNSFAKPRHFDIKIPRIDFLINIISDYKKDTIQIANFNSHKILGIYQFSRVAFNEDFTKACIIVNAFKSNICDQRFLYCAFKQNNKWMTIPKIIQLD